MSTFFFALALACSSAPETQHAAVSHPPAGGGVAEGAGAPPPAPSTNAAATPPVDAACLDKADLADGKKDGAVHNCTNCGLLMEGDASHASTHAGMTFHACSGSCKERFDNEPDAVLARACAKP